MRTNLVKILAVLFVIAAVSTTGCVQRVDEIYSGTNIGASPITPWSDTKIVPEIDASAYIHPQASVIGAVHIGRNVMVSPQASLRGDEGMPIYIGNDSNIQDGVSIHALETRDEEGRPVEKNLVEVDGKKYAVYIGNNVSMAHQAQVHGPASVGDDTFVGMQAFVFKSRVGSNVVLEPGVRIVGVNIPDGRYVHLGMIVENQSVADALPVITEDYVYKHLNEGVLNVNTNLAKGYNKMDGVVAAEEPDSKEIVNTSAAPNAIGPYSQAIKVNKMIYLSGQIAIDPKTQQFIDGDIETQTKRVLDNLKAVIEASGGSLESVDKTTIYLTDINDFSKVNEIYASYFSLSKPARSTVCVAKLPKNAKIEIDAIAEII